MIKTRFSMLIATIFVAFAFSMMWTSPAFADDSAPPPQTEESADLPPATGGDATPAVDEGETAITPTPTFEAPTEEAPATATPTLEDEEQAAPVPTEEMPAPTNDETSETPASILEQTPSDTQVVILDENGEVVPLATNEAADAIVNGDPQWCPAGVKPGGAGCSPSYTSFQDLLNWFSASQPDKAGTIWIESTYKSDTNDPTALGFTIDGSLLPTMANYALTIQGGWTGVNKNINSSSPSEFNVPLHILGWNNAVTINNIVVTGLLDGGSNASALFVETTGKITLNNVDVIQNSGSPDINGAVLDNRRADDSAPSDVVVINSTFSLNTAYGLTVKSKGTITITGIAANSNSTGVHLDNTYGAIAKPVTINGNNNQAKFNSESGVFILSNGAVTINNLTATKNIGWGAYIKNDQFVNGSAPVTLTGANIFNNNANDGLAIFSDGAVSINNVTANNNGLSGVQIDNHLATNPQAVVVSGSNSFNNNLRNGLDISSMGAVAVANLTANNNGGYNRNIANTGSNPSQFDKNSGFGVTIINTFGTGNVVIGTANAGWCNSMSGNFQSGLDINTNGSVVLSNICANGNGGYNGLIFSFDDAVGAGLEGYGASINNSNGVKKPVTLKGQNTFNQNYNGGLWILSKGEIKVANLRADQNSNGIGAMLDNSSAVKPAKITLTGYIYTSGNAGNGLQVLSKGAIKININDANISNNGGDGWNLNNHFSGAKGGITLTAPAGVQDRVFSFSNNSGDGIYIESFGAISIAGLDANNNGGVGAHLKNDFVGSTGTVTLIAPAIGSNSFNDNGKDGLLVESFGAITVGKLEANNNADTGVTLKNAGAASSQNVTLNGFGNFNNNGDSGLYIYSKGIIATVNLTADNNGQNHDPLNGYGVRLDNKTGVTVANPVILNGTNRFSGNYTSGLSVISLGAITVKDALANNNQGAGIRLNNQFAGANGGVTVTTSSAFASNTFTGNGAEGLWVASNGVVKLSNLSATNNISDGVSVDTANHTNQYKPKKQDVVISGVNNFSNNGEHGLLVAADGAITLSNVTAEKNGRDGAALNNFYETDTNRVLHGSVAISGLNSFNYNLGGDGLLIDTRGSASLSNITADNNSQNGIKVSAVGAINMACGSMTQNGWHGWDLSGSAISLKGVIVTGNLSGNELWNVVPVRTRGC
ncbi:MAG: hypothetical protein LC099_00185 [Anaerolineales bacterium]|nr:hypothetical protein [Anaerolineales bacterium]